MRVQKPIARPAHAVSYLRVSTDKQADSGLGLDAQRSSVAAAAGRLGLSMSAEFVDAGVSGSLAIGDRPVLMDAVSALGRADVLLVAKRDRLGRDVIEVAMIERLIAKRGARIVSAAGEGTETDDPASVLMRRLIDSFAEYERLIIAARTRAALAAKRQRGERISRFPPYGYGIASDGRKLVPEASEQAILGLMRGQRGDGVTLRRIAADLNDRGFRNRAGSPWTYQNIQFALRRAG